MNYWLVGATWGGSEDALEVFLKRGYWYCWDLNKEDVNPDEFKGGNSISRQLSSFSCIKVDDRIAVKRLCGKGAKDMRILALGIVKDICHKEHRIYVDWIAVTDSIDTNLPKFKEKKVDLGGCISSIHGPYSLESENDKIWLQQIFCI